MKNKILVLALIAAVLTAGLVLVGCHQNCPGDGGCAYEYSANPGETRIKDCDNYCISNRFKGGPGRLVCDC